MRNCRVNRGGRIRCPVLVENFKKNGHPVKLTKERVERGQSLEAGTCWACQHQKGKYFRKDMKCGYQ